MTVSGSFVNQDVLEHREGAVLSVQVKERVIEEIKKSIVISKPR